MPLPGVREVIDTVPPDGGDKSGHCTVLHVGAVPLQAPLDEQVRVEEPLRV